MNKTQLSMCLLLIFSTSSLVASQAPAPAEQSMDEQIQRVAREFQGDFNKAAGGTVLMIAIGAKAIARGEFEDKDYVASAAATAMMADGAVGLKRQYDAHNERNDTWHTRAVVDQITVNRKQRGFVRHFIQPVLPIAIPFSQYHPASFAALPLAAPAYGVDVDDCIDTCKSCSGSLLGLFLRCSGGRSR